MEQQSTSLAILMDSSVCDAILTRKIRLTVEKAETEVAISDLAELSGNLVK